MFWVLGLGLKGCVRSSATNTTVSPGGGCASSCVSKSFSPWLSLTHSVPCNLLSPTPAASGSFASNSSQDRIRPWWSFPVLRHVRLSPALCNAPWTEVLSGQVRALFSGQVGFIPLEHLLCAWLGMRKLQPQLGLFLEGMGSCFTRPFLCKSRVSEGSGGGYPCFDVCWNSPGTALCSLLPLCCLKGPDKLGLCQSCKHKSRDPGCNNRLHLLLRQNVLQMCEIRALSCSLQLWIIRSITQRLCSWITANILVVLCTAGY